MNNATLENISPTLQVDSLAAEPPGKSKNLGLGSQPIPSPMDLPNPGIEPWSPTLRADFLPSKPPGRELEKE